jgi:hypothetical protein
MGTPTPSYSQSLRAIGQALETLTVEAFELETESTEYLVRIESQGSPYLLPSQRTFLRSLVEAVWGSGTAKVNPSPQPARDLRYTPADIDWLESEGKAKRGHSDAVPDAHKLSQVLRVIGDHMNRKYARGFVISWSKDSVSIEYRTANGMPEKDSFRVDTLYDLGIRMYMRRASRKK